MRRTRSMKSMNDRKNILVSVCMIVRDEERLIKKSLTSVMGWADELVIGDTGSTDRTPEIAKDFGARVFDISWNNDFSAARNAVLDQASGAWIIFLDADEKILPFPRPDIFPAFHDQSKKAFFSFLIPNKNMTPRHTLRIFRRDQRLRYRGIIHENIREGLQKIMSEEGGEIGELPIFFDHFGRERNRAQKHARDLPLLLEALRRDPKNTYYLRHLGLTYSRLGQRYLAKEAWTKAIRIIRGKDGREPTDSLPFIDFIKMMQYHGKSARVFLDEALNYFPDNPQLVFYNGRELLIERRPWEAIFQFQRLLRWGREMDYDRAIAYTRRIFDGYSLASLASCYLLLGQFEKSRLFCEKAKKYDLGGCRINELLDLLNRLRRPCDHRIRQSSNELMMKSFAIKELRQDKTISQEEMRRIFGDLPRTLA